MLQVPSARLILSCDASPVTVYPGHLIGRLASADVVIADPRISEAHALISLRQRTLRILGLRGVLAVDGIEVDALTLTPGVRVDLADGLSLTVDSVQFPTHTLVLLGTSQGPVELGASAYSLLPADGAPLPTLRLVAGYVHSAAAHLWHSGARLWIRGAGQDPEPIESGGRWMIAGCPLRVIQVPLGGASDTWTRPGRLQPTNLVIVARYSSVHVQRGGETAVLTGKPANLVSELVGFGKPVSWQTVSREIWGERVDSEQLRDCFDATIGRLRRQLRDLGIRENLVALDGSGNIELVLYPGDQMINET